MADTRGQPFHLRPFQEGNPPLLAAGLWLARCVPALVLLLALWALGDSLRRSQGGGALEVDALKFAGVLLAVSLLPVYNRTLFTFLSHAAGWAAGACGALLVLTLEYATSPAPVDTVNDASGASVLVGLVVASAASLCLQLRTARVDRWEESQRRAEERRFRELTLEHLTRIKGERPRSRSRLFATGMVLLAAAAGGRRQRPRSGERSSAPRGHTR